MALSLGSALATKVYLGATEVSLAYLGATQVYTSSAFSAEATNYFSRLDAAGDTTYVDYKQPLANYIDSLVSLGGAYWDTMLSSTSFVGVGIQGVTVPLRDGMTVPTNNNFVAGDLDQLTGLKGDASTKYLDTGWSPSSSQDDFSYSVYATAAPTTGYVCGSARSGTGSSNMFFDGRTRNQAQTQVSTNIAVGVNNITGTSRDTSAGFDWMIGGYNGTTSIASQVASARNFFVFSRTADGADTPDGITDARLATYHAGAALDLATLEGLQDTLLAEIAGIGFSTEAANYFSRLAIAGDTTFLAYRQPLANYIDSLVALGGAYWDDMLTSASFVGVGIQGVTVPLRDGMTVPTNNNFVAGDLDQLTGLKGDASTKYIATNVAGNAPSQNDASASVYIKESKTSGGGWFLSNSLATIGLRSNATQFLNGSTALGTTPTPGLYGVARSTSTDIDVRSNATDYSAAVASTAPNAGPIGIFAIGTAVSTNARLVTYHVGAALTLSTLEALQDTLITEIAAI